MKQCTKCLKAKPLLGFYNNKNHKDGLTYYCKSCFSEQYKKYRRTKEGVITQAYSSQEHASTRRGDPPPTYTKQELKEWCFSQKKFHELYDNWVKSGYKKTLKPSCDRTDDYRGYSLDRLQIITWGENNAKGYLDRRNGVNNKGNKAVLQYDLNGDFIKEYHSQRQTSRETGISRSNIGRCCRGERKTASKYIWTFKNGGENCNKTSIYEAIR